MHSKLSVRSIVHFLARAKNAWFQKESYSSVDSENSSLKFWWILEWFIVVIRHQRCVFNVGQDNFEGTMILVFRPADKGGGGAKIMLEARILENVDAIFGLHLRGRNGPILAGSSFFKVVISGKKGHAAISQYTIDPILATANIIVSLQHLVSRDADPLDSQVVTVAKFQGGSAFAFNVILDSVTISGTFRAFSKESLVQLKQRIEEVITRQTAVQRCNITVNFDDKPLYPSTVNNKELHRYFGNVARDMLGEKNAQKAKFFAEAVPGYFYRVEMQNETQGQLEPRHSLYFTVNEDVLLYGVAFHVLLATRYRLEYQQPKSTSSKGSSHDEL
ncbi:hypothetical protein HYC85_027421 [Camellia sinensis]|uniref:Peptidase M20 dimerisation domain-containing protein n=1 Tax=Camellia sinensis TaxID=4442 RepID=A0A7J7G6D1_CAMSI|nr:hypothetical protein HYC85_027421 [Camellia sinensis]